MTDPQWFLTYMFIHRCTARVKITICTHITLHTSPCHDMDGDRPCRLLAHLRAPQTRTWVPQRAPHSPDPLRARRAARTPLTAPKRRKCLKATPGAPARQRASCGTDPAPNAPNAFLCIPAVGMQQVARVGERYEEQGHKQSAIRRRSVSGARLAPSKARKGGNAPCSPRDIKRLGVVLQDVHRAPRAEALVLVSTSHDLRAQRRAERQ